MIFSVAIIGRMLRVRDGCAHAKKVRALLLAFVLSFLRYVFDFLNQVYNTSLSLSLFDSPSLIRMYLYVNIFMV